MTLIYKVFKVIPSSQPDIIENDSLLIRGGPVISVLPAIIIKHFHYLGARWVLYKQAHIASPAVLLNHFPYGIEKLLDTKIHQCGVNMREKNRISHF